MLRLHGHDQQRARVQVQYRMHPNIARFASIEFYGGRIRNGPGVLEATTAPYHSLKGLGPMAFYHVDGTEETPEGSSSIVNAAEADLVVALVHCLVAQARAAPPRGCVTAAGNLHASVVDMVL
jgi:AAA domain